MENKNNIKRIHFIGIGGISVSAIAQYCIKRGVLVSGSDNYISEQTKILENLGAKITIGHHESNLYSYCGKVDGLEIYNTKNLPDLVVYSSAIASDNKELVLAQKLKIPTLSRSQFLAKIFNLFSCQIAVCGSHGKTTATALLSQIFISANFSPTVFVGGQTKNFGNFLMGEKDLVIYEACEYKKNFLSFNPNYSVVLNIDNDHLDSYINLQNQIDTFGQFLNKCKKTFVCFDDKNCIDLIDSNAVTFGFNKNANYVAKDIVKTKYGYSFKVFAYNIFKGKINLKLKERHNILNALSAIAVADYFLVDFKFIKSGIENFKGIKRRNELVGEYFGIKVYCDYAHHPTEISAVLKEVKRQFNSTLIIFQPHTYSRTKTLKQEFINALISVKNLIIYKTYPAREKYDKGASAKFLYNCLSKQKGTNQNMYYCSSKKGLSEKLSALKNKINKILVLGAGDIYQIIIDIVGKKQIGQNKKYQNTN